MKLEKFDKPDDVRHEEVIDRIKEVINKLEDGLNQVEKINSPKPEPKKEVVTVVPDEKTPSSDNIPVKIENEGVKIEKEIEKPKKLKKGKKLRLLRQQNVNKQVEKVKNELEEVRKQVDEMRKQMLKRTECMKTEPEVEMSKAFLLPGEWCCHWVNGQPVGTVSEIESEQKVDTSGKTPLPRRSVQVGNFQLAYSSIFLILAK